MTLIERSSGVSTVALARHTADASVFLDDADRPSEREVVNHWLNRFPEFGITRMPCEKGLAVLCKPLTT